MSKVLLLFVFFVLSASSSTFGANNVIEFTSSNLPIVIINTHGDSIEADERIAAEMGIIWNENNLRNYVTDSPNNYNGRIEIEFHGKSSLDFPKKSFRVETQDSLGENLNVSVLGMPKENDWILQAPYSDKTLMRNALSYTLAAEISEYAPRVRFCELVLNDNYQGVYVLTEKIKRDKNRVNITQMLPGDITEPEISGGYIFKKDNTDPWDNIIKLERGLELVIIEPSKDEIINEQKDWLVNYLNEFENVLYSGGDYSIYIDVTSFVDNFLMVELTKNIDGYRLSTYFQKDRNGKIKANPIWDYDLSLGNADFNNGWTHVGWYHPIIKNWDKNWWVQLVIRQNFNDLVKERWIELRNNQFTKSYIFSMIDDWVVLLEEAQERNFVLYPILGVYVWPNPGFPESGNFGYNAPKTGGNETWVEEISFMKDFIQNRLQWMDRQFGVEILGVSTKKTDENKLLTLHSNYPNPFNSSTKINYTLKEKSDVRLIIYDVDGRIVKTLVNRSQSAGDYSVVLDASGLACGIYFYKLKAGYFEQSHKMLLVK